MAMTAVLTLSLAGGTASARAQNAPASLDVKPAFMLVVTNITYKTNLVIVTNYTVVTNIQKGTNYYNAQGVLLTPVQNQAVSPIPGAVPVPAVVTAPPTNAGPDPAVVKAAQLQAVRDLLVVSVAAASNQLAQPGSFSSNATRQIQMPQGVTNFDRKRGDALIAAMNATAERSVPAAAALLAKTAGQIQSDDPGAVIKGDKDAGTRLLLTAHGEELAAGVVAIVQKTGVETKLREAYSNVMLRGGGLLGAVLGSGPSVDIDSHVAQGVLKALMDQIAARENTIRNEPAARPTKPLQEAFKQ